MCRAGFLQVCQIDENLRLLLSQLIWHFLGACTGFAWPAEHPAHHVEDAEQGHSVRVCPVADFLKFLDEPRVIDELVVQVVPPLVVCAGPAEDLLDAAVVDGEQAGPFACQELAGRDGADPVALGAGLDVADRGP
jgi:hypothetical protein